MAADLEGEELARMLHGVAGTVGWYQLTSRAEELHGLWESLSAA